MADWTGSTALIVVDVQKGFDDAAYWGPRNNPDCEINVFNLIKQDGGPLTPFQERLRDLQRTVALFSGQAVPFFVQTVHLVQFQACTL